jgi:hypothetical protein
MLDKLLMVFMIFIPIIDNLQKNKKLSEKDRKLLLELLSVLKKIYNTLQEGGTNG